MFEIKDTRSLRVKIYGEEIAIKKLTISELETLQEEIDSSGHSMKKTRQMLEKIGVPPKLAAEMAPDDAQALVEYLVSPKKS